MKSVRTLIVAFLLSVLPALAHIGSPDVYFEGKAGPYPLLVTIRPPDVIPGVASVEVRSLGDGVREIRLTPTPMTGEASKHPPVADVAQTVADNAKDFSGSVWLMRVGSWEVHVHANGAQGAGDIVVPVAAVATKIKPIGQNVAYFLFGMMIFLTVGMVAIVGASVREAQTPEGTPSKPWNARAVVSMLVAAGVLGLALWFGGRWWGEDESLYRQNLYKPLSLVPTLSEPGSIDRLDLRIRDPGWLALRRLDDLVPDHSHMMHLFLVRWPAMDVVYHLHPDETAPGYFAILLPSLSAGHYRLFGDIVHDSGLSETAVGEMDFPEIAEGKPLTVDDAGGVMHAAAGDSFDLGDGYRMVWLHRPSGPIPAREAHTFEFEVLGPDGEPVALQPYMGMGGHAEVIKDDGSVFAHIHPTGTVSMASMAIASPAAMMAMHDNDPGPVVAFPYGMPSSGDYRIFVQMKHDGRVVTGGFKLDVR